MLTVGAVLFTIATPFTTFAATPEPPACLMAVLTKDGGKVFATDTVNVTKGSWVYVLWVSTSNSVAYNSNNAVVAHSGFVYAMPTTSATYAFRFTAGGEEVRCSATLNVVDPAANYVLGPTTLRVATVPLLSGGVAYPSTSVPVAYVQIVNMGNFATILKGFDLKQTGSASTDAIIGLTTIDDKGLSRGYAGGAATASPFASGTALAPADAVFLPGQRRLFTVRAGMANTLTAYKGTQLILDVTGIEASPDTTIDGIFPIRGTVWSIQ